VCGSQITKERGKGGEEYQGEMERGCNAADKVEQNLYCAVVNRRRLRVSA